MSYYHNDPAHDDGSDDCITCGDHSHELTAGECRFCAAETQRQIGADLYRSGRPLSECSNAHQREGWGDAEWEVESAA